MMIRRVAAVAPVVLLLAACTGQGGNQEGKPAIQTSFAEPSTMPGAVASGGASGSSSAGASAGNSAGATDKGGEAIPGADTAAVKITKCVAGKYGTDIELTAKNTTKENRNYVIAVAVKDGSKNAGGTAAIVQVAPGKTEKATAATATKVKKPTCTITNIGSVPG